MRLSEVIDYLQRNYEISGDIEVLISKDSEGNRFSYADSFSLDSYFLADGELNVLHPDDVQDYLDDGVELEKAVVIWP